MNKKYLMAIDGGTGSIRAVVFDTEGNQLSSHQREWFHHEDPAIKHFSGREKNENQDYTTQDVILPAASLIPPENDPGNRSEQFHCPSLRAPQLPDYTVPSTSPPRAEMRLSTGDPISLWAIFVANPGLASCRVPTQGKTNPGLRACQG